MESEKKQRKSEVRNRVSGGDGGIRIGYDSEI